MCSMGRNLLFACALPSHINFFINLKPASGFAKAEPDAITFVYAERGIRSQIFSSPCYENSATSTRRPCLLRSTAAFDSVFRTPTFPLKQSHPKLFAPDSFVLCGEDGIRTHGTRNSYTRFPSEPIQPLWHLSKCHPGHIKSLYSKLATLNTTWNGLQ